MIAVANPSPEGPHVHLASTMLVEVSELSSVLVVGSAQSSCRPLSAVCLYVFCEGGFRVA